MCPSRSPHWSTSRRGTCVPLCGPASTRTWTRRMWTRMWTAAFLMALSCGAAGEYCYDEPYCDPYAWGDFFPSCHPLLEEHHSPIDLDLHMRRNTSLEALQLDGFEDLQGGHWTLENDGHSVVLSVGSGMSVSGGGLPGLYHTLQLHFHWGSPGTNGSEHTLGSRRYPMEMHIVNVKSVHPNVSAALDDPTGLAVLGFFMDVAYADNVHFSLVSQKLSSVAHKGQVVKLRPFPLMSLLPKHNLSQFYRYHGSLTTPPCSRAVVWTVYEVPIYISWSQRKTLSRSRPSRTTTDTSTRPTAAPSAPPGTRGCSPGPRGVPAAAPGRWGWFRWRYCGW